MAYEQPEYTIGVLPADFDLSLESANQFTGVCVAAAVNTTGFGVGGGAIVPQASSANPILGVLQNNPIVGQAAAVMVHGISKVLLSGTVTIGQLLKCVNGQFLLATSGTYAVAQALESGGAGDIIAAVLIRNGKQ